MADIQAPAGLVSLTDLIDNKAITDDKGNPITSQQEAERQAAADKLIADKAAADALLVQQQQQNKTAEQIEQERVEQERLKQEAESTDSGDLTVEDFFKQVDTLRGEEIFTQIEYGQVDPMSPEGFLLRDKFIEAKAIQQFERSIADSDPRAYAYLLHRQNGGDDESFFTVKSFVLPPLEQVKESVDLQRTVVSESLKAKGIGDKQVAALLKASIDAGELAADAEEAYKEIKKADQKIAEVAAANHEARVKQQKADIQALDSVVNDVVTTGKELKFQIPDSEKTKFAQAFKANVHYEDGNFYYIKPISKDSLPKIMESELFAYLGADLAKMVQKQAQTISANKFINKAKAGDTRKPGGDPGGSTGKTLGEI